MTLGPVRRIFGGQGRQDLRAWAELLRVSALFTVPGDALAGAASCGVRPNRGTALAVGASLCLYEAGMALNDWADRDEDAVERPHRPIPSGRITPNAALAAATGLTATGLFLASRAGRPSLALSTALAATVWAYDLRLKHTAAGPAAMGAARALDVLLGATATRSAAGGVVRGGGFDRTADAPTGVRPGRGTTTSGSAPAAPASGADRAPVTTGRSLPARVARSTGNFPAPPARRGVFARLSAWSGGPAVGQFGPAEAPAAQAAGSVGASGRLTAPQERRGPRARLSARAGRSTGAVEPTRGSAGELTKITDSATRSADWTTTRTRNVAERQARWADEARTPASASASARRTASSTGGHAGSVGRVTAPSVRRRVPSAGLSAGSPVACSTSRPGAFARLSAWAGRSTGVGVGIGEPPRVPVGRTATSVAISMGERAEALTTRLTESAARSANRVTSSTSNTAAGSGRTSARRTSPLSNGSVTARETKSGVSAIRPPTRPGSFASLSAWSGNPAGSAAGSAGRFDGLPTASSTGGHAGPLGAARSSAVPRDALLPAALLGAHTLAVTTVSRREVYGGSVGAPLAALVVTGVLGGVVGRSRTGTGPDLVTPALAATYVVTAGRPLLHTALNPSPQLTQRAVGGGIRAMIPFQAALAARGGAPGTGLAVMALVPLARKLAKKVSVT